MQPMRTWALALVVVLSCDKGAAPPPGPGGPKITLFAAETASVPDAGSGVAAPTVPHLAVHGPRLAPLAPCPAAEEDPLAAARKFYDQKRYDEALSCAAEAGAVAPEEPQAFSEKAAALTALGRTEEAQLAYARAFALDPDHMDSLLGAAHLYGVTLPSTRERDELAALYAQRGLELAAEREDEPLKVQFGLMLSMAMNDLGEAKEALARATEVLALEPKNSEAAFERAIALFELCRFKEAKAAFTQVLGDPERSAHAHHHLGLLAEREGKWKVAERHFAKASEQNPKEFPAPELLPVKEFQAEVEKAVAALPDDMKKDLEGIPVQTEELPRDEDLKAGDPPLSPSILGLFRGPPLREACPEGEPTPCRSVALYRRNLARAARGRPELLEQIRVTLLHEIGHLRGEDDYELAARGLE